MSSGDAFLPLQTPDDLKSGVEIRYDPDIEQHYFKLPGRGGSSVPPWILTPQMAIPRGTQSVHVSFDLKCDLGYPSGASNQGVGVRLLVITRAGDGTSEDTRIMFDSNPEDTTSDTVWYRQTHGDIRPVTRIIQMPEEVIGGSHIIVQLYTRGTGGSADIYGGVRIRNHYSRTFTDRVGKSIFSDGGSRQFQDTYASPFFGAPIRVWMKKLTRHKATIPRGRPVRMSCAMLINLAEVRSGGTFGQYKFFFGIGVEFQRRSGGISLVSQLTYVERGESYPSLEDLQVGFQRELITQEDYKSVQPVLFFAGLSDAAISGGHQCKLDHDGIDFTINVDDAVDNN